MFHMFRHFQGRRIGSGRCHGIKSLFSSTPSYIPKPPQLQSSHHKSCINATDVVTCIISSIIPTETFICRNLQILLVTIKTSSEWVSTKFKANSFSTPCITPWKKSTVHCVDQLRYILIISVFNFLIFIHFTNKLTLITLKPSLAQKFKLIFKFRTIKGHCSTNFLIGIHTKQG